MSLSFSQPFPLFQSPISSPAAAAAYCCCCCRTAAGCWLPTAAATSPFSCWCASAAATNSGAAAAATTLVLLLLLLLLLLPYCRWLLAADCCLLATIAAGCWRLDYVLFYPVEYRSGTSPKPGSNVLFPSALPLASAGVGGYMYECVWSQSRVPCSLHPPNGMGPWGRGITYNHAICIAYNRAICIA